MRAVEFREALWTSNLSSTNAATACRPTYPHPPVTKTRLLIGSGRNDDGHVPTARGHRCPNLVDVVRIHCQNPFHAAPSRFIRRYNGVRGARDPGALLFRIDVDQARETATIGVDKPGKGRAFCAGTPERGAGFIGQHDLPSGNFRTNALSIRYCRIDR